MAGSSDLLVQSNGTGAFGILALVVQAVLTGVFYTAELNLSGGEAQDAGTIYSYYVGVALMMFVGFGYLMTFLKAYGLGAVGLTMFVTCLGVEFAMIVEGFMSEGKLSIDFFKLLNGNCAIATVLISFGALIGKVSPVQLIVLTLVELVCCTANKVYVLQQFAEEPLIGDIGGTIIIHVFGAYFGLAAARVLGPPADDGLDGSSYVSDIFSLVGTVFLWLFWPSFVAGLMPAGPAQTRALINTVIALLASTVTTFGLTPMLMGGKIGPVPIQNATLAGGVSIGATANIVGPFGAMLVGGLAGLLSTWGFVKGPFGSFDTCGIHNLHGMPGVFGGLVSVVVPLVSSGTGLVAWKQAVGLIATMGIACVTGAGTGGVLKLLDTPDMPFSDTTFWACAEDTPK